MTLHYLVTGSAGFIGAKVAGLLLEDGHHVTGIDNLNDAYDIRLKEWRLSQFNGQPGFEFLQVDICDKETLREVFDIQFDAVLNLAARAGVRQSVEDPWAYFETNVTGTLNVLEMCKETGVGKFVQASTSSIYGASNDRPFVEDTETGKPLSPYAASKKAAETLCYTYHYLHGIDVTVPRYFTVYGPAGRPDMSMFRFVQWVTEGRPVTIYGDGQQSRDFTYVDDIARGTIASLRPVGYEIINLGSDSPVSLLDVVKHVEKLVNNGAAKLVFEPPLPADPVATWADISKARRLLDWSPETGILEGISNLVQWYAENREWTRNIAL